MSPAKRPAKAKQNESDVEGSRSGVRQPLEMNEGSRSGVRQPLERIECDVLVAGAGSAGLSAAHAFAAQGRRVVVAGKIETHLAGRTVALFEGSLRFYRALGLWPRLAEHSAPMEGIRMIDDTGSIFPTSPKEFRSREIDLDAFGENIENNALVAELAQAARENPAITLIEDLIDLFELNFSGARARLASGGWIDAKFIVAGEGRNSQARQIAGITVATWSYPQVALTALLVHEKPHHQISTEFHKRSGPFTFVPLRGREGAPYRSSLVWLVSPRDALRLQALSPEELAAEIEDASHGLLGKITLDGPLGSFPMGALKTSRVTGTRMALIGESAHLFPPIGAQGLNLSLRDIANLVDCLEGVNLDEADDIARGLERYERQRARDIGLRLRSIDVLNRSLLVHALPVDFARAFALNFFSAVGPLRRALMREGVTPHGPTPKLMRASPPERASARRS
ncbi:FAD-dependent monooxygenase [Rhodoblastus sp.]|uniref:FAD-dependent monooxygenase n=1 Tax=Rhodoblastus sp. TaxID=1962975 RepID=UPI002621F129|nr:FAD-dependent monooxygenase [Rhodoblastus sp.]